MNSIKVDFDNLGFTLKQFTDDLGNTYSIEGKCTQCGRCCISPTLSVGFNDAYGRCAKLVYETRDGKIAYRCATYQDRPVGCVLWPRELQDLKDFPECTFKIVKI